MTLTPNRFERVKEILLRVVDLPEAERQAVLDQACGDDRELRAEVEELLAHDQTRREILMSDALRHRVLDDPRPPGPPRGSSLGKTSPRLAGQTVSHYLILDLIGEGGMGQVYRARDTRLGREVALKVISPTLSADAERIRRFEQEARAAGALNHPNIVAIHDIGVHENAPFVVMELLDGQSLRQRLKQGPIPVRKATDYAAQCAYGLAAAHAKGVVHRDIKPENLFVTQDGRVKILDFGVAKLMRTDIVVTPEKTSADSLTGSGVIIGTSGYMSPEQAQGRSADARSDIFALGATLYEMLTGQRSFQKGSFIETLHAIVNEDPSPMSGSGREIPAGIEAIVRHCLEKSPEERFQSARDLAFAIEGLSGSAVRMGERAASAPGAPLVAKARQRRWGLGIYAACALVFALVGLIAARLTEDPGKVDLSKHRLTPFATSLLTQDAAAWSPDGRALAFLGQKHENSDQQVWIQAADASAPVALTRSPFQVDTWNLVLFWAPDGRTLYCPGQLGSARPGLYKIPVGGGDPTLVQVGAQCAVALSPDGQSLVWLAQDSTSTWRMWWASPPDGPRHPYEPAPFTTSEWDDIPQARYSPDGSSVLLFCKALGQDQQAWILPWPPGESRRASILWSHHSWMPDSRHVIVSAERDLTQPFSLWLADPRTGRSWPILLSDKDALRPSVTADGRRIAYSSRLDHMDVIEVPLKDAPPRTLVGSLRNEQMPALSRDGKELVYLADAAGVREVRILDLTTGLDRCLLSGRDFPPRTYFMTPTLSSDRQRYAVVVAASTAARVHVGYVRGGGNISLTGEDDVREYGPTWSPDGTRLACYRAAGSGQYSMVAIRLGASEAPVQLQDMPYIGILPEWSPDGGWIAAVDSSHTQIVLLNPDGSARRSFPISAGELPLALAWSHDGRSLFVIDWVDTTEGHYALEMNGLTPRHCVLSSIDVQTGHRAKIRDLGWLSPASAAIPGGRVSVSPDDTSLVYSVTRPRSEIWILEGVEVPGPWYTRLLR